MSNLRKKYIVNKKFQLRTTFSIIGLIFVILALLVTLAGINLLHVNDRITNMLEITKTISDVIAAPTPGVSVAEYNSTYAPMQKMIDQNKLNLDKMLFYDKILISIIIAVVFFQGFILFYILIRQTHRIAGPIYVMTNYMRQIIDGRIPEHIRALRKSDFFQDSYDVFREMVHVLREREKK